MSGDFRSISSINGSDINYLYLIQVLIITIKKYANFPLGRKLENLPNGKTAIEAGAHNFHKCHR